MPFNALVLEYDKASSPGKAWNGQNIMIVIDDLTGARNKRH